MHAASAHRRALLLALALAFTCLIGAGALLPDDAPGGGAVPMLAQPAGGPAAGMSAAIDRLRAELLARWRRVLAALLGNAPVTGCPAPPRAQPRRPRLLTERAGTYAAQQMRLDRLLVARQDRCDGDPSICGVLGVS